MKRKEGVRLPRPRLTDGRLRGGCCVLCLSGSSGHFWLLAPPALLLLLECLMVAAGNESVCDKLELIIIKKKKKGTQKPLQLFAGRHRHPGHAVAFVCVGHAAASSFFSVFGTGRNVRKERQMDGRMEEEEEEKERGFSASLSAPPPPHHHSLYLESLLMTRISAPFSSFRRWLSARRSTRTWRWSWGEKKKRCTQIKNSGLNFIKVPHWLNMRVIK